jgi:hypothetical protein
MHQFVLGLAKYLVEWTQQLIVDMAPTKAEGANRLALFDLRVSSMARYSDGYTERRGYADGPSALGLPTADDIQDVLMPMAAALGACDAVLPPKERKGAVQCLEAIHRILCSCRLDDYSEADCADLDTSWLDLKRRVMSVFGAYSPSAFAFVKWHAPEHLSAAIRLWGRPRNFDTHYFERMHSPNVKVPYRSTNFRDAILQIMRRLRRSRVMQRLLLPMLGRGPPVHVALRPPAADYVALRGRKQPLSIGGAWPFVDTILDQLPAAWASMMEARFGDAYDPDVHAFDASLAIRYRALRLRRTDARFDGLIYEAGHHASLVYSTDAATGNAYVPNGNDAARAWAALPLFFFCYHGACVPPAVDGGGNGGTALLDDADVPDEGLEQPDIGDGDGDGDSNAGVAGGGSASSASGGASAGAAAQTAATPVDTSRCFVAFYWLSETTAAEKTGTYFQWHAPRRPNTAIGLVVEPINILHRTVRTYPNFHRGGTPAAVSGGSEGAVSGGAAHVVPGRRAVRRLGTGAAGHRALLTKGVIISTNLN